jgi:glycosyltransferase involved in cell wall biosynthesis
VNQIFKKKIGIVIPAFNPNPSHLYALITRIVEVCKNYHTEILIVDDGSENSLILPAIKSVEIQFIKHNNNLGKGAALKTGFHHFLMKNQVEILMTLDADLQHPPEKIPEFINAFINKDWDIIVGYRSRNPALMPLHRILSNTLTSLIISMITGQLIRDSQCGFRLVKTNVIKTLDLYENRFHLESEILLRAAFAGFKIGFVPVPTIYSDEKSYINNIPDTLNFVGLLIKLFKERLTGKCISYNVKR